MASKMAGRSARNSASPTRRTMWRGAIARGDLGGERRLVLVAGRANSSKAQRDGADVGSAGIAHQAEERPGIDAGGEKQADLDVGQQVRRDAVERRGADAASSFAPADGAAAPLGKDLRQA